VPLPPGSWTCLLTTEDGAFCQDPEPVEISEGIVCFKRPGGVVLHSAP
jgi:hypothetical protein